jgi:hypothetical protein
MGRTAGSPPSMSASAPGMSTCLNACKIKVLSIYLYFHGYTYAETRELVNQIYLWDHIIEEELIVIVIMGTYTLQNTRGDNAVTVAFIIQKYVRNGLNILYSTTSSL